ncbi:MAG: division/cell wall cluster transcriptional repressor MraZ [Flavobacteriales bacterium]|nr:division/cell wall cluster transcriptional repressor MraZ [Flavobacteriales bacterium]
MLNLLGEHRCKVDSKGRLMFPAKLRKQLEEVMPHGLVINRDIFEKCLVLYPKPEWDRVNGEMARLSRYNREHQLFQRKFMMGASGIELDKTGRLLLPSILMEFAGIKAGDKNDIIVSGLGEKIEIWSMDNYNQAFMANDDDFARLAEKVRKDIEDPGRIIGLNN